MSIDYHHAVALRFDDREHFKKAVAIAIKNAPQYYFLFADPATIIVNKTDQALFSELEPEIERVASPDEVTLTELAELRYENLFRRKNQ